MRGCCDETDVLFTFHQPLMEGFIAGIGCTRERFGIIELELVLSGFCIVTVITNQER